MTNKIDSTIFKGRQVIPIMNQIGIDIACFGNHEFDYGLDHLLELMHGISPKFPWLLSNLKIVNTQFSNLDFVEEYRIETINGIKVGFFGLMEKEWLSLCPMFVSIPTEYENFIDCSKRIVKIFKAEKCDLIIALTHMREYNN